MKKKKSNNIHLKIERQNIPLKIERFFLHSIHLIFLSDFNCIKVVIKLDKLYKLAKRKKYMFFLISHMCSMKLLPSNR